MASYPGEDEQLESLKKWWKENGTITVVGFVIGLAALFGGRAWFDYQQTQSESASADLALLINELNVGDNASIGDKVDALRADYANKSHSDFAALIGAKAAVDAGELASAKEMLQAVIDNPSIDGLDSVATLRLARIEYAEGNYDTALGLINSDGGPFAPHYEELKGDIYVAKGDTEAAREAYQSALANPSALASGQQLRIKLDNLGKGEDS